MHHNNNHNMMAATQKPNKGQNKNQGSAHGNAYENNYGTQYGSTDNYGSTGNAGASYGESYDGNDSYGDSTYKGLSCLTCVGKNEADCKAYSKMVRCQHNEQTCQTTIRSRDGYVYFYQSMCKQDIACANNAMQNSNQCRPDAKSGPSVCRYCTPEVKIPTYNTTPVNYATHNNYGSQNNHGYNNNSGENYNQYGNNHHADNYNNNHADN